jgi:hypothetical protein
MAQIPDYTALGPTPVPTPSYRRPFIDESARGVDEALAGFGATIERAGQQGQQQDVNFARSQASTSLIDHELAVKTQTEAIRDQVASGQLSWDQAPKAFDDWNSKQQTPQIANLDPMGQELLERGMKRNALGGTLAVQQIANTGKKQAFADNFGTTLDSLGKLAGMPGADIESINSQIDAYRPQALAAGIPAANVDKAIQSFKDRNWLNNATQRSMEAKEAPDALEQLRHDLTDADGFYAGKLDTEKRDMVLRTVINDQLILQNRMDHEADKREAKAQSTIGRIDEQISSGVPLTPDMWAKAEDITKGTSFEQDFKQRIKDEDTVQHVLRQPVDQQMAYVQQRTQELDQQGGTLRDKANLIRLQTAVQQNVNLMQKAPLLFAANRNGTDVQPLDFSALSPSPVAQVMAGAQGANAPDPKQQFGAQIADRMATLKALRTQYGSAITPSPLLPQEAAQLSNQLESATPPQRTQMLMNLRGAMGDDQAYQNAMRQIAPHSPVTAIAGSMIGNSAPASTPVWFDQNFAPKLDDVTHVLRGEQLLNPSTGGKQAQLEQESGKGALHGGMPMPPDGDTREMGPGLRSQFGRAAGDVFRDRPELADAYFSVFKDAYASLLAEKGDMKGQGDPKIAQRALDIALGQRVQFNGQTMTVPPGMDPSRFEGLVRNAVAQSAQQLKAPADWADRIRGYGLREVGGLGSGQYQLTNGNTPLVRPDGKGLFTVDLRDQYLAARGAHRNVPAFRSPADRPAPESSTAIK